MSSLNTAILHPSFTTGDIKPVATRKAFGAALKELGGSDKKVVVLDADLSKSTMSVHFAKAYPERFFEMGIAEANMISTAAGLALNGYTPFVCSFAAFISGRFDQIKMSVAYSEARVRIVGTHAGVGIGPDGYSQQGLEDLAMLRTLPNMLVLQPADDVEAIQMVNLLATDPRPAYLRLTRQDLKRVHDDSYQFTPGVFPTLLDGDDITLIGTGGTVEGAVEAGLQLHKAGIRARVLNGSCLQPVDADAIERAAKETRGILTIEDHSVRGGLGGAVTEAVCDRHPAIVQRHGLTEFGESGTPADLYKKHRLDGAGIFDVAKAFAERLPKR